MADETPVVHSDPEIMSGTPVFTGTRVPFQTLLDYLDPDFRFGNGTVSPEPVAAP